MGGEKGQEGDEVETEERRERPGADTQQLQFYQVTSLYSYL